ncbi:PD-(D/E)XK nuclease family protein [Candidatus Aenigmatarchaeota archaeon]
MTKYKLSPSSLNLLENCPKCFWLYVVKKIRRPSMGFPTLPSGIDKIMKVHFDKHRKQKTIPPELEELDGIKLFDDIEQLNIWRNNFKGIQFLDEESDILLRGAVDDMLVKDKKLIVLDYKTRGYPLKEDTHHHYQDQVNLYNFLLRKNGYETEDYAYLLFLISKEINDNGDFVFDTHLVKMDINLEHAEELFKKAIQVLRGEMPESSETCKFCEWAGKKKRCDQ